MSTATFIGGPLDLTRMSFADSTPPKSYSLPRATRSPKIGYSIEGSLYDDLGFFESRYQRMDAYSENGKYEYVFLYQGDTDRTPSEVTRLRKAITQAKEDLNAVRDLRQADNDASREKIGWFKKQLDMALDVSTKRAAQIDDLRKFNDEKAAEIARLNDTLSAVGNALTAKTPQTGTAAFPQAYAAEPKPKTPGCAGPCQTCDRQYPERVR